MVKQVDMYKLIKWSILPTVLIMSCAIAPIAFAQEAVVKISLKSEPDPLVVKGRSGGEKSSDCGNISATPSQVLEVTEPLPYLKLQVQSEGEPTLLIEGPGKRRFCVLADTAAGEAPEISGYWEAGKYSLYVGDRAQGQHPYTLSISQQKGQ
jgi:hypothetical protein